MCMYLVVLYILVLQARPDDRNPGMEAEINILFPGKILTTFIKIC